MALRLLAALAAFALIPSVGLAQVEAPQPIAPATAPQPGMQFNGTLWQSINSKSANVNDPVVLVNVNSTDGSIMNARMFGHVAAVTRAGEGRNGQILLAFDTLQLANGTTYPVAGEVMRVEVKTPNNGAKEVLGALGGMIVGNILGKWIGAPANVGGIVGAAGGYVVAKNSRENVNIPANSNVAVRLVRPHPQAPQGAGPYQPAEPVPPYAQPGPPAGAPPPPPQPAGTPG